MLESWSAALNPLLPITPPLPYSITPCPSHPSHSSPYPGTAHGQLATRHAWARRRGGEPRKARNTRKREEEPQTCCALGVITQMAQNRSGGGKATADYADNADGRPQRCPPNTQNIAKISQNPNVPTPKPTVPFSPARPPRLQPEKIQIFSG